MILRGPRPSLLWLICLALPPSPLSAQAPPQASSSSSAKHVKKPAAPLDSALDSGTVTNGVYRNKTLGLTCKIPPGWVLRTDEMNAPDEAPAQEKAEKENPAPAPSAAAGKVLLAAFSRPPEARAEEVNSSILIAAEAVASYPGLKEAAQYFAPLTEVAKAQGFTVDDDPYDIALDTKTPGTKTLVRGDFHKNVGSRVMHQSTLVLLFHGYAVSITVIAGTDDEVEDLVDGLSFEAHGK